MKKLNKSILKEIILEVIREASSSRSTSSYQKGKVSTDQKRKSSDYDSHKAEEPSKTLTGTRTVSDTSRWTHPYSGITTSTKTTPQPSQGWQYRQATTTTSNVPDTSRWTHPQSKVTTKLGKGVKQPQFGWGYTQAAPDPQKKGAYLPISKKNPGKTAYGSGAESDYAKSQKDSKKTGMSKYTTLAKTTNPTTTQSSTSYATKYGQGTDAEYSTAQSGAGRDKWSFGKTTNPSSEQEYSYANPEWKDWQKKSNEKEKESNKAKKATARKMTQSIAKSSSSRKGKAGKMGKRAARGYGAKSAAKFAKVSGYEPVKGKGKKGKKKGKDDEE